MNKQSMKNPTIRKPKSDADVLTARRVAWQLSKLPEQLQAAELRYDTARAEYESYLTGLSIDALTLAIFPGKVEGENRTASNETERRLAIDHLCADEEEFKPVREEYESAQRDLDTLRASQENLRLIARLMINQ